MCLQPDCFRFKIQLKFFAEHSLLESPVHPSVHPQHRNQVTNSLQWINNLGPPSDQSWFSHFLQTTHLLATYLSKETALTHTAQHLQEYLLEHRSNSSRTLHLQNPPKSRAALPTGCEEVPSRPSSWNVFRQQLTQSKSLQHWTPECSTSTDVLAVCMWTDRILRWHPLISLISEDLFALCSESSAPRLKQDPLRKHTSPLTISLPLKKEQGGESRTRSPVLKEAMCVQHRNIWDWLHTHAQQNPGWIHHPGGTHKGVTSPSPSASRQSSPASEPPLLQSPM